MSRIVLDASALLAILNREAGAERLTPEMLSSAASSTVNLAEVQSKLVDYGIRPDEAWEAALSLIREAVSFTLEHGRPAGRPVIWSEGPALSVCPWETEPAWRWG